MRLILGVAAVATASAWATPVNFVAECVSYSDRPGAIVLTRDAPASVVCPGTTSTAFAGPTGNQRFDLRIAGAGEPDADLRTAADLFAEGLVTISAPGMNGQPGTFVFTPAFELLGIDSASTPSRLIGHDLFGTSVGWDNPFVYIYETRDALAIDNGGRPREFQGEFTFGVPFRFQVSSAFFLMGGAGAPGDVTKHYRFDSAYPNGMFRVEGVPDISVRVAEGQVIPEPATTACVVAGLAMLAYVRKRRCR